MKIQEYRMTKDTQKNIQPRNNVKYIARLKSWGGGQLAEQFKAGYKKTPLLKVET